MRISFGILEGQADRLRADLEDLADKLRAAADAYENQELESSAALDIVSTL
ncbi:MAG TPA: type VII secretion target [Mycobacterium sp.]